MTLRIAFMGTPDFAARSLAEIAAAGHEVVRVYTQPPRRRGRGQSEQKTPVHQLAEVLGIPVVTPDSFRDPAVIEDFASLGLDLAAVVAYGQILPQAALDAPRLGCLNLHASLLPRWRGAAPIQRAIMAGDTLTGVQLQQMEAVSIVMDQALIFIKSLWLVTHLEMAEVSFAVMVHRQMY